MVDPNTIDILDRPQEDTIDLEAPSPSALPQDTIQNRTDKYTFAKGDQSQPPDQVYQQIQAGNEANVRAYFSNQKDLGNEAVRTQMIQQFAQAKGNDPMTEGEYNFFAGLTYKQLSNPDTIMESEYAKRAISELYGKQDGVQQQAYEEAPDAAHAIQDISEQAIAKREYLQRQLEDLNTEYQNTGWPTYISDVVGQVLPFVSAYHLHNVIGSPHATSLLTGNNNIEQYAELYSLPLDEFAKTAKGAINELKNQNILNAQSFVNGALHYGSSDQYLDTFINLADLATVGPGLVKGVVKGTAAAVAGRLSSKEAALQFSDAMKGTIKSINPAKPDIKEAASAAGKSDASAAAAFFEKEKMSFYEADPDHLMKTMVSQLPSIFDPGGYFRGAFKLSREYADQIADRAKQSAGTLLKTLRSGAAVNSLPGSAADGALGKAFEIGRQTLKEDMTAAGVGDNIIEGTFDVLPQDAFGTGYNVLRLGKPGGAYFDNKYQAGAWQKELGIKGAQVKSSGDGYFLQVVRPIKETADEVKEALNTTETATPRSWLTTFLDSFGASKFRGPSEVLSEDQRGARVTAINRLTQLNKLVQSTTEDFQAIPKGSRKDFISFIDAARRFEDHLPDGTRVKGIEFPTQGHLETAWEDLFKRPPTAAESAAYQSYYRLNQYDYFLRNLGIYHDLARQGVLAWQPVKGEPWLQGIAQKAINWDSKEGTIRFYDADTGEVKNYVKVLQSNETKAELDALIKDNGYKLIQLVGPATDERPFNFVLAKTAVSKNIDFKQLPYKGGGHIKWDYQGFAKQGKLTTAASGITYHSGDNAIHAFTTYAEAQKGAGVLEMARQLYNADKIDELIALVSRELPTVDPEVLLNKFKNGVIDKKVPIVATRSGESSLHTQTMQEMQRRLGEKFKRWQDSDLNLTKNIDAEFVGKRGWDPKLVDEENPVFEYAKPRLVDPLPMLSQAVGRAIRNPTFQNYQIRSAEHFVEEFHSVLENGARDLDLLRKNPIAALTNPKWDKNADRTLLASARVFQNAATNLIGTQTEWGRWNSWMKTKLMDSIFNVGGKGVADFAYDSVLPYIPDPIKWARSVAFHTKLGLFNPVQLFLQAQTFTHTLALAPLHAPSGFFGGALMRMLAGSLDEGRIAHMAGVASKLGWKPEEFKEAYRLMMDSGILEIGPQHAWKDSTLDPKIFQSTAGKWLDKSLVFFNEGERTNHWAAFTTAYKEFRAANPVAKIDQANLERIMKRYDDLSVNMTHASSSALNRGFGAVAGQFFSYQERLTELLLGHRLTMGEKARAFAVYSAMYGVPTAGAATLAWPFYEDFRSWLLQSGNPEPGPVVETLMNGIPETMLHAISGTQFNLASRYGPGLQVLRDIYNGDATVWNLIGGAPGSILGDIFRSTVPAQADILGYAQDGQFSPKVFANDVLFALQNVSSINNGVKAYFALNAGSYFNQNGILVDDQTTTFEGLMMGITGLTPQRIDDVRIMENAIQHKQEAQQFARQQAVKYFNLSWKSDNEKDRNAYAHQGQLWMNVLGGFKLQERLNIIHEGVTQYKAKRGTVEKEFQRKFQDSINGVQ
jgi:hypothetical protein